MRLLLTTDPIGGVWTFTKELTTGLLHRGHAVALVSFGRHPSPEQSAWCNSLSDQYGRSFQFFSSPVPLEWMQQNQGTYSDAAPFLTEIVKHFQPDLLHSNQFCFGHLDLSVPIVITAHSDVLSWAAACRPGQALAPEWLGRYRTLVQRGLDGASAIVAPTRWMLDELAAHFELLPPARVIANGRSLPSSSAPVPRQMQAVSVGRLWDEAKNLPLLTRLNLPMPLVLAGEREHEESTASAHTEAGTPQWTLLGPLPETELLQLFRSSAIYLVASLYEPFGLAPLEAALCGCAIVANDLPSLREVWGNAALYFKDGDAAVRHLRHLQAAPAALAQAQCRAYRRALQLSAARMTDAYLALYNELLSPHPVTLVEELVADAG